MNMVPNDDLCFGCEQHPENCWCDTAGLGEGDDKRTDDAVTALIDYLDQEAEMEIESAGEMTDLGKELRRHEVTARRLAREAGYEIK